jgi:sterol desaturase/sphingolipid hydroxylase (fatty acid hydroxylase superfamily)
MGTVKAFYELDPITEYAVPVFVLFLILENLILPASKRYFRWGDSWASIAMGAVSVVIDLLPRYLAYLSYLWLYQFRLFDLQPVWWVFGLLFLADDFSFYWHHRLCHNVRLFWAAHVNHHSSENYNLAISLRQSWGELFHRYIWWAWLPLVGFHPWWILCQMAISLIYQFFLHTESVRSLGPLEYFLNTPSHHRVHHAVNVQYLDRNHAGILIIWDKLFSTFTPESPDEKVRYGITKNIHTNNILRIAFHEYAAMLRDIVHRRGWIVKLRTIFSAPGYSPDGSTKTTMELRRAAGLE